MVQDALIAAYRWLLGSAGLALRLLPLFVIAGLLGFGLYILLRRVDPMRADRLTEGFVAMRPRLMGPVLALMAALLLGGALLQARKMVVARRLTLDQASASRREEPSLSGVTQFAPAVGLLEEKTYRRTLTLPPDSLTRIGAEGVQVLAPYLSDPSAEEVLRLKDEFNRSGNDVVCTREVGRRDETTIAADAAEATVNFGAGAHGEASGISRRCSMEPTGSAILGRPRPT
ncbi:hypothetical protein EON82_15610 [bacterium]|nr:MAG: hypothetical protein EON82_15610 [bacterium]